MTQGIGCHVGHYFCDSFGYADDIVLLCSTLFVLKEMIKICVSYAVEHNITLNGAKTKILVFDNGTVILEILVNNCIFYTDLDSVNACLTCA